MISVSRLVSDEAEGGDSVRYGGWNGGTPTVMVWNVTTRCNLECRHCYATSGPGPDPSSSAELSTVEGRRLLADAATHGTRVVLFSGGEPLLRPDLLTLMEYAGEQGMRPVLSCNGTLLTEDLATRLQGVGLGYVGISLDGPPAIHDALRGRAGAHAEAVRGIHAAQEAGLKVGLRTTLTRATIPHLDAIFQWVERESIPRVCFYHLVGVGRGEGLERETPSARETRAAVDRIFDWTLSLQQADRQIEVLTVANAVDGVYLYLTLRASNGLRTQRLLDLLRRAGGNASGSRIGCVAADGTVHPDQFWRARVLGNIRQSPLSTIWEGLEGSFLHQLRNRKARLQGRCAVCRFQDLCNGAERARAEAWSGDPWAADPACYLTPEEVGLVD